MPTSGSGSSKEFYLTFSARRRESCGNVHLPADANGLMDGVDELVGPEMVNGLSVELVGKTSVVA
jgi:hypothetical protein